MARELVKKHSSSSIGSIKESMLTEVQFQSKHGVGWVLMDGRDVTGSEYADLTGNTVLPDARGQFLRGKNNGRADGQENPDGERDLGEHEMDAFQEWGDFTDVSQGQRINNFSDITRTTGTTGQNSPIGNYPLLGVSNSNDDLRQIQMKYEHRAGTRTHLEETRVKNLTVNIFIKINEG